GCRCARQQPLGVGTVTVCAVCGTRHGVARRSGDGIGRARVYRRPLTNLYFRRRASRRARRGFMRFVTTRAVHQPVSAGTFSDREGLPSAGVSLRTAMLEGLAPDGGLYVPESIDQWSPGEIARLRNRTLTEIGYRVLRPYTRPELDATTFEAVVVAALNFPIPLVEVEPRIYALELFHGPTLAFKDVGARTMARLMASLDSGDQPLTVLAATSGDTGSAVAHAFHAVPHTRVVVLYPEGRVSPTQEAQLTMFNSENGNVRAYAVAGSFDDCHRLTKDAFADADLRRRVRLTSANSV